MIGAPRLLDELKRQLKLAGITYRVLGERLVLSESAVKQMFASGNMTLQRLDAICEVLGIDVAELVERCASGLPRIEQLSLEQEAELVEDPRLLVVAYCVVNYWSFEAIIERYRIESTECIRLLARLDRMKLIELQPGNRIRVRVAGNFDWQPNGPIEQYFRREVQTQFFGADFDSDGALRVVKNGDISNQALAQIGERLKGLGQLFDDTVRQERRRPLDERHGTTMVLAIRQWGFSAFSELER